MALVTAGFVTHPVSAFAAAVDVHAATHVVLFESQGTQTQHVTTAQTVGAFLKERGITAGPNDYVHPNADTPLVDNIVVEYTAAVPVKLITSAGTKTIDTAAGDVGAFLEEQHIQLGNDDVVRPSLADPIVANATIRVSHVVTWTSQNRKRVKERTVHVIDFALAPGKTKVIKAGSPGERLTMVDYTQTDGKIQKHVVASRMLRAPKERVVAEGVGTAAAFVDFAKRSLQKTSYIAASAVDMVATAYTADCPGCSGFTATGYRAGRGIVAVDPRVIPLGTKLFIPGYGFAIAGDTGGAIVGNRIDLGFNSIGDAMEFGRRVVKVYTLK